MDRSGTLRFTKHHGAGNDFLVLLDRDARRPLTADEARALCDRHLGVGADGVMRATAGRKGAALSMELRNADGSVAEMSGNGIRCLVQAAVDAGWVEAGDVDVDTAAGRRRVAYHAASEPGLAFARVAMGVAVLGDSLDVGDVPGVRAGRAVDLGNPHLVLWAEGAVADEVVRGAGARLERSVPGGANVEFVWEGPAPVSLTMRVWERGVGETLACGTGTCAAAVAARAWGIGGDHVTIRNPGGVLDVELVGDEAFLGGPAVLVGAVEVDEAALAAMVRGRFDNEVAAAR